MLPFKSLDGATSAGPGSALDLERAGRRFTLFVSESGTGIEGSANIGLDGSPDGEAWLNLANASYLAGQSGARAASVADHLVRYVRANLTSTGANRVMSAWISASEEE